MGEGVEQGVGLGRRVILVFFGVWKGKRGVGGFFRFSIFFFLRGRLCGWAGFCVWENEGLPPWRACCLEVME
jgi:hypothetical protein